RSGDLGYKALLKALTNPEAPRVSSPRLVEDEPAKAKKGKGAARSHKAVTKKKGAKKV
ncbi:hypothetical protein KEM55_008164, partial [Ascosphaera atra]